jgi:hypothetical protein
MLTVLLKSIFTNVYLWMAILAIFRLRKDMFNKDIEICSIYDKIELWHIHVHYLVVLSTCYFLKFYTALPVYAIYLIAILSVLIISPALYELLKRIPILRYMVLGIQRKRLKSSKRGGNLVQKTFSEIKLFQVKPEKLEQFEALADV